MEYNVAQCESSDEIAKYEYDLAERIVFYLDMYSKTWSDEAYSLFLKTFNEYLDALKPITYIPDIAGKLSAQTIIPLWSVSFSRDVLENLLINTVEIKKNNGRNDHLVELRENLIKFMLDLGIEKPDEIIMECRSSRVENECLVYASILAVILATNP